jgi:hypothetical protein
MGCGVSKTLEEPPKDSSQKPVLNNPSNNQKSSVNIGQNSNPSNNPSTVNNILQKVEVKEPVISLDAKQGTIVKTFKGTLCDNIPFEDCLISNEGDLDSKLRKFISTSIVNYISKGKAKPDVEYILNTSDEILNKKFQFDFANFDLIVLNKCMIGGINLNKNNTYEVRPSQEVTSDNVYCAVYIRSPSGTKPTKFILMGGKPQPYVEQRAMNDNLNFEQIPNEQIEQIPDFHNN